jgi:MraZ protein
VFVGEFERSVDGAGRLALPASFRDDLGSKCYVTCDPEGFVKITTEETFRSEAEFLKAQVRAGEQPTSALRAFGTKTQIVSIDKQGRITLDETTRRHAGLRSEAVIAGALDSLEIWRPSRLRTMGTEHDDVDPPRRWDDETDDDQVNETGDDETGDEQGADA